MTTLDSTPAAAVLVAIDIAKVRNEVLIEAPGHKRRRRLLVLNTRAEHDRLIEVLQAYGQLVVCAFEATGNYHRVAIVAFTIFFSPLHLARVSRSMSSTRALIVRQFGDLSPADMQFACTSRTSREKGGRVGFR